MHFLSHPCRGHYLNVCVESEVKASPISHLALCIRHILKADRSAFRNGPNAVCAGDVHAGKPLPCRLGCSMSRVEGFICWNNACIPECTAEME